MFDKMFVKDIKTVFDAIRNIGLCTALLLGTQYINFLPADQPLNMVLNIIMLGASLGLIFGLYVFNLIWLFSTLNKGNGAMKFGVASYVIIPFLITVLVAGNAFSAIKGSLDAMF